MEKTHERHVDGDGQEHGLDEEHLENRNRSGTTRRAADAEGPIEAHLERLDESAVDSSLHRGIRLFHCRLNVRAQISRSLDEIDESERNGRKIEKLTRRVPLRLPSLLPHLLGFSGEDLGNVGLRDSEKDQEKTGSGEGEENPEEVSPTEKEEKRERPSSVDERGRNAQRKAGERTFVLLPP